MNNTSSAVEMDLRSFHDDDEPRVIELLSASLGPGPGGERTAELFRWKHRHNPFGTSLMLVAEAADRIVGLRAFMRWQFRIGSHVVSAVRAVDTATHPDFQGRGIFSKLTRLALEELKDEVGFVFNTPNDKSLPGYLKMGWRIVGKIPVPIRVLRPVRLARGFRSVRDPASGGRDGPPVDAPMAAEALRDAEGLSLLLERTDRHYMRLATPRTVEYLRWRYGDAPTLLDYRVVADERAGVLDGLAVFRVRPRGRLWESTVVELLVAEGDLSTAGRLLGRVAHAARVDHVAASFPAHSTAARAARRHGFLKAPGGPVLTARLFGRSLIPDPTDLRSWALSLGDVEVF